MRSVTITKQLEVSSSGASAFRNMAVWEGGYNLCLDICRESDNFDQNNVITQELKSAAIELPINLSKAASFKLCKQYLRHLKRAYVSTKQLTTLLLLCNDLNYIPSERFLDLNSKLNRYSEKLMKFIRFNQRKLKKKAAK
ncbi:four helix bundle protein [Nanoarchaeota archaeon]